MGEAKWPEVGGTYSVAEPHPGRDQSPQAAQDRPLRITPSLSLMNVPGTFHLFFMNLSGTLHVLLSDCV